MSDSDTIFALATPPGRSALAVFRISGRDAGVVLERLTGSALPPSRMASLRPLYDHVSGERVDQAIVTYFRGPASYTGEDLVELSVHGGRGVISAISSVLARIEGLRAAEPGEFTRRAYAAGKFDLSQAEAIADLIDSETEFQRRQALRLLEGGLGQLAESWRQRLIQFAAALESMLDFSDEGDVDEANLESLIFGAGELRDQILTEIDLSSRSQALRNGYTVVIAGPPNAGKSTLFNKIAGSDIAIVTEFAGTTRDLLRVDLDLSGVPVTLVDSAGLRDALDPVERIGVQRAREALSSADLIVSLVCFDSVDSNSDIPGSNVIAVWSKSDLCPGPEDMTAISENDSESISKLLAQIRAAAVSVVGDGSLGHVSRERHLAALREGEVAVQRFSALCRAGQIELAAEECRAANLALGRIAGVFDVEDVLVEIFRRFCIGK